MFKSEQVTSFRLLVLIGMISSLNAFSQDAALHPPLPARDTTRVEDSTLRIRNLNPYFTLHVDSTLSYQLEINRDPARYFFFMKNAPVGLRIRENGLLSFKADKAYFLSGKLKYDQEYKVRIGVQNLNDPADRVDTSFTLVFFTTEIIPSHVKPTVSNVLYMDEGDTISFRLQCETGTYPIESINFYSNIPIKTNSEIKGCNDNFTWSPPYDFVKETDSSKQKLLLLYFVGTNKIFMRDTATIRIYVKDALNYPYEVMEYNQTLRNINTYILRLKYAFFQLDKKVKKTKNTRTDFDMSTATTALGGTVLSSATSTGAQNAGKILPSVGVALVPVKETVAPPLTAEQNQAGLVRSSIKRLDYTMRDNALVGEKDMEITKKIATLKNELKQTQVQLIDVPLEETTSMTEEQLNAYFDNPKVNKKYRLKKH
ncbi:MAG: hypothetical protein Q8927_16865 [Bacteroidota bacterium]|nr:hypothetical protein [Bacteroidota bacterium]MDP4217876.1 hypothetical protein [Bacteroidota bacterium]MDP4247562.1 hypothetical protein [Bacteroidota bacterium]MDP4254954.1 hypothetical protein [Bacteroidota bacterium]MDP4259094.1 hypothetical protein [Bacteroidota bacterium]